MDFGRGPYIALKEKYHNCRIFPCFIHIMQRIYLYLPEIKKNDENIKILAKDLVDNIKLLCFVYTVEKDNFYNKIKKKYIDNFKKFFKYFENAYLYKDIFSDRSWNYYNYCINFDNNDRFFLLIMFVNLLTGL